MARSGEVSLDALELVDGEGESFAPVERGGEGAAGFEIVLGFFPAVLAGEEEADVVAEAAFGFEVADFVADGDGFSEGVEGIEGALLCGVDAGEVGAGGDFALDVAKFAGEFEGLVEVFVGAVGAAHFEAKFAEEVDGFPEVAGLPGVFGAVAVVSRVDLDGFEEDIDGRGVAALAFEDHGEDFQSPDKKPGVAGGFGTNAVGGAACQLFDSGGVFLVEPEFGEIEGGFVADEFGDVGVAVDGAGQIDGLASIAAGGLDPGELQLDQGEALFGKLGHFLCHRQCPAKVLAGEGVFKAGEGFAGDEIGDLEGIFGATGTDEVFDELAAVLTDQDRVGGGVDAFLEVFGGLEVDFGDPVFGELFVDDLAEEERLKIDPSVGFADGDELVIVEKLEGGAKIPVGRDEVLNPIHPGAIAEDGEDGEHVADFLGLIVEAKAEGAAEGADLGEPAVKILDFEVFAAAESFSELLDVDGHSAGDLNDTEEKRSGSGSGESLLEKCERGIPVHRTDVNGGDLLEGEFLGGLGAEGGDEEEGAGLGEVMPFLEKAGEVVVERVDLVGDDHRGSAGSDGLEELKESTLDGGIGGEFRAWNGPVAGASEERRGAAVDPGNEDIADVLGDAIVAEDFGKDIEFAAGAAGEIEEPLTKEVADALGAGAAVAGADHEKAPLSGQSSELDGEGGFAHAGFTGEEKGVAVSAA